MNVNGNPTKAIWFQENRLCVINQTLLPFEYNVKSLNTSTEVIEAIKDMTVRGAPVIGATAAYGVYFAFIESQRTDDKFDRYFEQATNLIKQARPTAVNLSYAVDWMCDGITFKTHRKEVLEKAQSYANKDIEDCYKIGEYGLRLIKEHYQKTQKTVNILTHCNAGWLATGEYGTATAPIYLAYDQGIPVHVWVDETRPRNQGANLTAWELQQHGIPFTLVADNTGGHLMQHQMVDMVIVGSDRTSVNGDVANKIGTYLKALAAFDNHIPFYVALPTSSIDFNLEDGVKNIPIEKRDSYELTHLKGININNKIEKFRIFPNDVKVANYAFDVTPAQYVTGLITEKGVVEANRQAILGLQSL